MTVVVKELLWLVHASAWSRRVAPVVLVACSACSGRESTEAPLASPDVTIAPDEIVWLPSDTLLHDVRDIAVDGNGHVWVLSGFPPYLRVIDEDGVLHSAFGPHGEGPGELRNPWYLVEPTPSDSSTRNSPSMTGIRQ